MKGSSPEEGSHDNMNMSLSRHRLLVHVGPHVCPERGRTDPHGGCPESKVQEGAEGAEKLQCVPVWHEEEAVQCLPHHESLCSLQGELQERQSN